MPYGDADALRAAVEESAGRTVAVLLEPIQGEGGVVIPPEGFLRDVRAICSESDVLMVADEIQSGLGRTGRTFACDHEGVVPDVYVLGKALGGGLYPVSAIAADHDVLDVITPGSHGSTFGGNPLAAAIGHEVVQMLMTGEYQRRAAVLGERLREGLRAARAATGAWPRCGSAVSGPGSTWRPGGPTGRELCERLLARRRAGQGHPRPHHPPRPAPGGDRERHRRADRRPAHCPAP